MNNNVQARRNRFRKAEWFGIIAIFIIAFVTGYLYTTGRLEKAEDNQIQKEQTEEPLGDVQSDKTP